MKCPKCHQDDNNWTLVGNCVVHNDCNFTETCSTMLHKYCKNDH